MKISSQSLELKALHRVCKGDSKSMSLLGQLKAEHFHSSAGATAFARISTLISKGGIPSWDVLCEDPIIRQDDRKALRKIKKSLPSTGISEAIDNLSRYTAARQLLIMTEKIVETLNEDKADIDALGNEIADDLFKIKTGKSEAKVHIFGGKDHNTDSLIKKVLTKDGVPGVPTGFKTWDKINSVIPSTACMLVAATTGGGKSIMASTLCRNMAEMGFHPAMTSLEMSPEEIAARWIASLSKISIEKIMQGRKGLSSNEIRKTKKVLKSWQKSVEKAGGGYSLFEPGSTPTMSELLFSLKPYEPDVIIVDYIALLGDVDGDDDWRKMSEAVRFGKRFARANGIPVIILAQLGNDMQLRYSKRMLDDADIAWVWQGDSEAKESSIINIEQHKARNLKPFPFSLRVEWEHTYMRDLTDEESKSKSKKKSKRSKIETKEDSKSKSKKIKLKELD